MTPAPEIDDQITATPADEEAEAAAATMQAQEPLARAREAALEGTGLAPQDPNLNGDE